MTTVVPPAHDIAAWTATIAVEGMPQESRPRTAAPDAPALLEFELDVGLGRALPAVIDRVVVKPTLGGGRGGVAWWGRIPDGSQSSFVLASVDGAVAGALWHSELGNFNVVPIPELDAQGRRMSKIVHLGTEPGLTCGADECARIEPRTTRVAAEADRTPRAPVSGVEPMIARGAAADEGGVSAARDAGKPCDCGDDGSRVDIVIVYTPQAAAQVGGGAAAEAVALASVESMNLAMASSAVLEVELNLVAVGATSYAETLQGVSAAELFAMQRRDDGILDDVHVLREQYGADIVAMLHSDNTTTYAGLAFVNVGAAEFGFADLIIGSAVGGLVFAHEIGHNFGLSHDRANGFATYCHYAFGNRFTAGGALRRTIMAYPPGQLVPYYSNPDVEYLGVPTGVALGAGLPCHNALAMQRSRVALANNIVDGGTPPDCNGNGIPDCDDLVSGFSEDLNANGVPDECETRLYVNAAAPPGGDGRSWGTAFRRLSDAIGEPVFRCGEVIEVWVAAGVYTPTRDGADAGRQDAFWIAPHMRLLGGFAGNETSAVQRDPATNLTVLTGDRLGNDGPNFANRTDNCYRVVAATSGTNASALIDGFTIRGGHADSGLNGGNDFGSGVKGWAGMGRIHNCVLTDNFAHWGGAIAIGNAEVDLVNCLITGNRSDPPGSANGYGAGLVVHNEFVADVVNCTIVGNQAIGPSSMGGGIYVTSGSTLALRNSIVWGNTATLGSQIALRFENAASSGERPSEVSVGTSAVMNGQAGVDTQSGQHVLAWLDGNLTSNPQFVSQAGGNFRLSPGSPCIDAGDDRAVPVGLAVDLDQSLRFVDGDDDGVVTVDLGAYERQLENCLPPDFDCDGIVGSTDVGQLLGSWGSCARCAEDLDGDGDVGAADLAILLGSWG
ncbi:MAG: M12 family metallo-peptidase [Phycisphaerales bacterium]